VMRPWVSKKTMLFPSSPLRQGKNMIRA
jgi:hypothetical protein